MSHTELLARHRAVLPSWLALYYDEPIAIERGEGRHVWDAEGRRYLDFFGGILTTMTAHALPEVVAAVREQAGKVLWGIQAHGVVPDVLTFAKGLGNGLSVGGVVAPAALMDGLTASSISTFGGSPITTAGALANLTYALDHDLQGNAREVGGRLLERLRTIGAGHDAVGDVRGKGLIAGIELVRPGSDEPDAPAAGRVLEAARARGLLIGKGGLYGNVLRIAPPLTLTAEEADEGADLLQAALQGVC